MSTRATYTVAVYDVALAYGGPEEGSWYYDRGSLVRILRTFRDEEKAYQYCRRVNGKLGGGIGTYPESGGGLNARIGRYTRSSTRSDGTLEALVMEGAVPEGFPSSRPYYE